MRLTKHTGPGELCSVLEHDHSTCQQALVCWHTRIHLAAAAHQPVSHSHPAPHGNRQKAYILLARAGLTSGLLNGLDRGLVGQGGSAQVDGGIPAGMRVAGVVNRGKAGRHSLGTSGSPKV
jgi:hypothetical protein